MKERLRVNDNIKTAMMLVVALYHSCMFFTGTWFDNAAPVFEANYLGLFARWLGTFHVQTFTMASGFLFYALKTEKGKYSHNFKLDIKNRAKRLLLPYFSTIIFWVLPFYIVLNGFDPENIFYKYVLGSSPSQLWFLPMLFWLFIFGYILFKNHSPSFAGLFSCIAISIVGGYILDKIGGIDIFQIKTAVNYAMFYYLGTFLYQKKVKLSGKRTIGCIILSVCGFIISNLTSSSGSFVIKSIGTLAKNVGLLSGVLMVYGIATILSKNAKQTEVWSWLKNNSFGIYLFHQQLIYLCIMCFNGKVHPVVQVLLSFIIAIVLSSMMTIILRKWKVTRTIFSL